MSASNTEVDACIQLDLLKQFHSCFIAKQRRQFEEFKASMQLQFDRYLEDVGRSFSFAHNELRYDLLSEKLSAEQLRQKKGKRTTVNSHWIEISFLLIIISV